MNNNDLTGFLLLACFGVFFGLVIGYGVGLI